jgi:hypothetical protein
MVKVVYLETMETTMGKLRIEEEKSMTFSPLHIGGKQGMYIGSDKSNTTRSDKMDVNNKETITDNYYQKSVTKD